MARLPHQPEDTADRAQFRSLYGRLLLLAMPLVIVGETLALARGSINGWVFCLLLILDPVLFYLVARLLFAAMDRSAAGLARMVYAGGGHPLSPAHSGIESLEARGFYAEAGEAWQAHLIRYPTDHAARFKLADLCRRRLADPATAERLYLEVRSGGPTEPEERQASNQLIELYRESGRRDRQLVELARFAARWRGTRAGNDAARTLLDLKQSGDE